eukprot:2886267-Pleurochrysis_carterae.AAC.1
MHALVLDGLSQVRLDSLVSDSVMSQFKSYVTSWMENVSAELERRLAPARMGKEASMRETVREVLNIFNGLE